MKALALPLAAGTAHANPADVIGLGARASSTGEAPMFERVGTAGNAFVAGAALGLDL